LKNIYTINACFAVFECLLFLIEFGNMNQEGESMKLHFIIMMLLLFTIIPYSLQGISILANESEETNFYFWQALVVNITFSAGNNQATLSTWIDTDANSVCNENTDHLFDSITIIDNDCNDEDPAVGIYKFTHHSYSLWILRAVYLNLLFKASDTGGFDIAALHVLDPNVSEPNTISGTVTPAMSSLFIIASQVGNQSNIFIAATNPDGSYNLGLGNNVYNVTCIDPFGLTEGRISQNVYNDFQVNGQMTGLNFFYGEANTSISGHVTDQDDQPIPNLQVNIRSGYWTTQYFELTDENGDYNITIGQGSWSVNLMTDPNINNYLSMNGHQVTVGNSQNLTCDFQAYETDSTIQGSTYLDSVLTANIPVKGICRFGESNIVSDQNGHYTLKVSSEADDFEGYSVSTTRWDIIHGTYCFDTYQQVMSGSNNIDFYVHTITGGIEGHVYDSETGLPIECYESGSYPSLHIVGQGMGGSWGLNEGAFYHADLAIGLYTLKVVSDYYYSNVPQDINVGSEMQTLDFNLIPVVFAGSISGHVYNSQTLEPLSDIDLHFITENYVPSAYSDSTGHYSIELPNGVFDIGLGKEPFYNFLMEDVVVQDNDLIYDLYLTPTAVDDPTTPIPVSKVSLTNYPNPFNPETTIQFEIPSAMNVRLDIMNIRGQLVKTVTSEQYSSGIHNVSWNGKDANGKQVASGVYLYRIITPVKTITNKMLMLK
jgi:hypothetical protein